MAYFRGQAIAGAFHRGQRVFRKSGITNPYPGLPAGWSSSSLWSADHLAEDVAARRIAAPDPISSGDRDDVILNTAGTNFAALTEAVSGLPGDLQSLKSNVELGTIKGQNALLCRCSYDPTNENITSTLVPWNARRSSNILTARWYYPIIDAPGPPAYTVLTPPYLILWRSQITWEPGSYTSTGLMDGWRHAVWMMQHANGAGAGYPVADGAAERFTIELDPMESSHNEASIDGNGDVQYVVHSNVIVHFPLPTATRLQTSRTVTANFGPPGSFYIGAYMVLAGAAHRDKRQLFWIRRDGDTRFRFVQGHHLGDVPADPVSSDDGSTNPDNSMIPSDFDTPNASEHAWVAQGQAGATNADFVAHSNGVHVRDSLRYAWPSMRHGWCFRAGTGAHSTRENGPAAFIQHDDEAQPTRAEHDARPGLGVTHIEIGVPSA